MIDAPKDYAAAILARLDALEAIAKAATPGPWANRSAVNGSSSIETADGLWYVAHVPGASCAAHITAFDPPTALALIACIRQALLLHQRPDPRFLRNIATALGVVVDARPTTDEAQIMRHALGLDNSPVPYRNYYNAPSGSDILLDGLVSRGFMERIATSSSGYKVTNAGMSALGVEPTKILARHQPCGCVVCTCDDEDRCHGCGAKHCGTHPVGQIPNPVYVEVAP